MNFLDRNEFNFDPSEDVIKALKNFPPEKLCFYTRIYDEGKKSILSEFLAQHYGIEESRVMLGYGGEDILKQAVHYYLSMDEGNKKMLVPKFSWWYYKSIADEINGITIQYPLYEDGNTYRYDFDALREVLYAERPRVLLLASPNNPTGNSLTPGELADLLRDVPSETVVLVDEAYASFVNEKTSYIRELTDEFPNLIIVRTLSKFYGLPGLRMGFAFLGNNHEAFAKYGNKYLGYNRLSEDIAIAALKSEDHYRAIANSMNADRQMYKRTLEALPGFKVYDSQANFILVKYPVELKEALQNALLSEDYKIKFMNEPDINSHVRITLGRPEQNKAVADAIVSCVRKNIEK